MRVLIQATVDLGEQPDDFIEFLRDSPADIVEQLTDMLSGDNPKSHKLMVMDGECGILIEHGDLEW